eukprot:scaffold36953_cov34-Tisochrysis_lutea.AAC.1
MGGRGKRKGEWFWARAASLGSRREGEGAVPLRRGFSLLRHADAVGMHIGALLRPTVAALVAAALVNVGGGAQPALIYPPAAVAEQGDRGAIDAQGRAPAVAAAQDAAGAIDLRSAAPRVTSRVYLDVSIDNMPTGRLVIDLFGEACPRAAENFRALCSGEKGFGYAGSSFYRVVQGLTVQGGSIAGSPNGPPGQSIYGPTFPHDNYDILHNLPGIVRALTSPQHAQTSGVPKNRLFKLSHIQYTCLARHTQVPADGGFLDGRYEAFGRVSEGMDVLGKIEQVQTVGTKNRPAVPIVITSAGQYALSHAKLAAIFASFHPSREARRYEPRTILGPENSLEETSFRRPRRGGRKERVCVSQSDCGAWKSKSRPFITLNEPTIVETAKKIRIANFETKICKPGLETMTMGYLNLCLLGVIRNKVRAVKRSNRKFPIPRHPTTTTNYPWGKPSGWAPTE